MINLCTAPQRASLADSKKELERTVARCQANLDTYRPGPTVPVGQMYAQADMDAAFKVHTRGKLLAGMGLAGLIAAGAFAFPPSGIAGICLLVVGIKTINKSAKEIRTMRARAQQHKNYQMHLARTREVDSELLRMAQTNLAGHVQVELLAAGLNQGSSSSILETSTSLQFGAVRLKKRPGSP